MLTPFAFSIYVSILANTQSAKAAVTVPAAAMAAGATKETAEQVLAALPLGAKALEAIPGIVSLIVIMDRKYSR